MWFEIDASGIKIKFQINGYRSTNKDNWDSEWCRCDFLFSSGEWLNYHIENEEVLLASEVEELEEKLSKLLDNKLTDIEEMVCIEPDFIFKLYPQTDLREDPKYTYIQPGYEIQDIYLEWKIFFWHEGLTDNYLTITLDREKIERLRDYLVAIINWNLTESGENMKLRILDYLTNVKEINGVSLTANLQCTCGASEFQFFHTGKQTKGILAPFIGKKERQLVLKAVCPCCLNSIIVYDSTKDGADPVARNSVHEFVPFVSNKVPKQFPIVIKYNYFPENLKIEGEYTNKFETCYIYSVDKDGKDGITLMEE